MSSPRSTSSFNRLLNSDAVTSAHLSSSQPSHAIHITQPCRLFDIPTAVRSMMLDYLDDCTASHYLSSCRSLYADYHHYPVKRAVSVDTFTRLTTVNHYHRHRDFARMYYYASPIVVIVTVFTLPFVSNGSVHRFFLVFWINFVVQWLFYIVRHRLVRRRDCCCVGRRVNVLRGWYQLPRVQRLSDELRDMRLLRYLHHLTELTVLYKPIGKKYPLPHSLRTLRFSATLDLILEADTFPPRLTSLSLSKIKNTPLPADVLPESLTSLQLTSGFDTQSSIGAGVLPASLQRLEVDEWKLPLSRIVLPPSLIELDIHSLSNYRLPVLPPQLQVLAIGGAFNQPLTGVLPSGLRVLRLTGHFSQPLTAIEFASTPVLEELYLGDHSASLLALGALPRSLLVLRVGKRISFIISEVLDAPPQLRRVILSAGWFEERVVGLQQLAQSRGWGFTVEHEAA